MQLNLLQKRYFLALFAGLVVVVYSVIYITMQKNIQEHLDRQTIQINSEYNNIFSYQRNIANLIFKTTINKPEVIKLIKNRERKKLYQLLEEDYEKFKKFSIRQLHFHLPDNVTLLRMHRPGKYGDDLSKVRLTVKHVNENKKYIDGFEEGKTFNGFRFIYPLFDEEKHLGSVEISFSALAFISYMIEHNNIKANFFIDKSTVDRKVIPSERSNYMQSPVPEFYFETAIIKLVGDEGIKRVLSKKQADMIYSSIQKGEPFSWYDERTNEIVTHIPLRNPISQSVNAAFSFRQYDMVIGQIKNSSLIIFVTIILVLGAGLILLYKQLRYEKDLQAQVENRTHELLEVNEELSRISKLDPLTGAYNRRYFSEVLEELFALSKRQNTPLSLAIMDMDDFKSINDRYGHDIGDKVLQVFVDIIQGHIRESDLFARFGGEEFILLLPHTDLQQAVIVLEKLRKLVASCDTVTGVSFTVSIGVSELNIDEDTIQTLIKRADNALYKAKQSGKNKTSYM